MYPLQTATRRRFDVSRRCWDLWDVPQLKSWLLEVPRQQRIKRMDQAGGIWEGAARWTLLRSLNPNIGQDVLASLTLPTDPGPFNLDAVRPPAALERLLLELGAQDGHEWVAHNSPERVWEIANCDWSKERVFHPELQAWLRRS